ADANNLYFDFGGSAADNAYLFFEKTAAFNDFVCFGPGGSGAFQGVCAGDAAGNTEAINEEHDAQDNGVLTGKIAIAPVATPEPSSLLMLVIGVGLVFLVLAKRRNLAAQSCETRA